MGGPDAGRNAYVQNLLFQRQMWLQRPVGLVTPITLIAVGAGVAIVGATLASTLDTCDHTDVYTSCSGSNGGVLAGVLMAVGGSVLATVGTGILIGRIVRRARRGRELRRIDSELNAFGVTASVAPWMNRSASASSGGLSARLRF